MMKLVCLLVAFSASVVFSENTYRKLELEHGEFVPGAACPIPPIDHGYVVVFPMYPRPEAMVDNSYKPLTQETVEHGSVIGIQCDEGFSTVDRVHNEFECMNGEWINAWGMGCVVDEGLAKRDVPYVNYGKDIKTGKFFSERDSHIDDDRTNYFFEDEGMFRSDPIDPETLNEFFDAIEGGDYDTVFNMANASHGLLRERDPKTNRSAVMSAVYASNPEMLEYFINKGADIERNYSLLVAAQIGYAPVIEQLIWSKARLEVRDPIRGRTPLMWAAALGHVDAVGVLVDHDADILAATDDGNFDDHEDGTPIHLAIVNRHVDVVQAFLDRKPDLVHAKNRFDETPLMTAAYHGRINIVGRLIKYDKAPLEEKSIYGKTALMVAGNNDQLAVVKQLARNGANMTARSFNMRTPLQQVTDRHLTRIVHYYIAANPRLLEEGDQQNNTALHMAVDSEFLDYIDYFTAKNPECVPVGGFKGRTAVHNAAAVAYMDGMNLMIERYPSVIWSRSFIGDGGDMPIHSAVRHHQLEVVQRLIEINHLQKEAKNTMDEFTPLQMGAHYNDVPIVCWLSENGADLEVQDETGRTSLIIAAKSDYLDVVKCLVENGADLLAKTFVHYDGITALHAAADNNSLNVIQYLVDTDNSIMEELDALGRTAFMHASMNRAFEAAGLLIDLGANTEAKTFKNESALWIAASIGDVEMVTYLHRHGCDIDSIGIYGRTPLLAASAAGHLPVVKYLVGHGAKWTKTSYYIDGTNTALHLAKYFHHQEVAAWLEKTLPDLMYKRNAFGLTPDEYAISEHKGPNMQRRH